MFHRIVLRGRFLMAGLLAGFLVFGATRSARAQAPAPAPAETLQAPADFLGYPLGTQFTPHHRVVDYVRHVAAHSPNVQLKPYGTTYEGRPLLIAFVSAPENLDRLETIRQNNLRMTGLVEGAVEGPTRPIVWLSYNVHGNESVSTEAAIKTLYALANPQNARTQPWLQNTVVAIDPCLNPDGRERYVQWYKRMRGAQFNAALEAREHHEPWPGGRANHYYFDLNRDWAWGTQQETRQRLALYNRWLPQIHVDFHEQGMNEPYYFAPAAKPFHENITDWQRQFQYTIGRNHARYFDRNNWLYFTREVFDLYYPGYGDTWPIFNGAIGMTYEQGGSGRAGLAVETADGDTLTLRDRMLHHHTTGLSTVEVAHQHADRLLAAYRTYYDEAQSDPPGEYATYVIHRGDTPDRLAALAEHLDFQGIQYRYAAEDASTRGFDYEQGGTADIAIQRGDLIVPARQPKSRLAKVLLEPRPDLADSLTYDITAWALPYAYDLDAAALPERFEAPTMPMPVPAPDANASPRQPYAYLVRWHSLDDVRLLTDLLQQGVEVRFAEKTFAIDERTYAPGTLIIARPDNDHLGARFDRIVTTAAQKAGQPVYRVETGFVSRGPDFGSDNVPFLEKPTVAVLSGAPLSSYAVGEVWHYFDRQIGYPTTLMHADDFEVAELDEYDVLVLPSGRYSAVLDDETLAELRAWVHEGGRLIALDGAVSALTGKEGFALKAKETTPDTTAAQQSYALRARRAAASGTPGSIHRVRLDPTHPLGFGFDETYFTLKLDDAAFALMEDEWNVGVLAAADPVSGFMGHEAQQRVEGTLVFGVEPMGEGAVVYMVDNPLFRGFWQGGERLFANAVFFVGQD